MLKINQNELYMLEFQYSNRETGETFGTLNPHLAADFDIFGKGSLFQYLNRCSTAIGKNKFAEGLCQSQLSRNLIKDRQQAVNELSKKAEWMQNFQASGMFITESGNETESLQLWLNEPAEKLNILQVLRIVVPLFNFCWIALIFCGLLSINSITIPIVLSLFVIYMNIKKINKAHEQLGKSAKTFEKYTKLIQLIENENFESAYLQKLQQELKSNHRNASNSLTILFKLLSKFDYRYNVLMSFILNSLVIFDIQIYCLLSKWKEQHKNIVTSWFSALSEMDALISFSTYAFNNQGFVSYPKISEKAFAFQAEEMGHPLLHPSIRVCNSLQISNKPSVIIITGANMAGKSTFLRTLSVNLILAMNGAPVCAKNFEFTPSDILSSIKIQDSLSNNESYFYAELLRLKDIIHHVQNQPNTFVILDEILRGTNTKDKQLGSIGLLEKLISQNAVVIIATHDLVIGELEKKYPGIVVNHCFEVELTNNQLVFDYKLKKGISQKLNASFLMKKMEIID
jgi:DNA mismatch repair ATPase MutS